MVWRKIAEKINEKRLERQLRRFPKTKEYVLPLLGENKDILGKIEREHGEWMEKTLENLESSERQDVVQKFARIVAETAKSNPKLMGRLRILIPKDPAWLLTVLKRVDQHEDHRETIGEIVLYDKIKDEARIAELQKLMDQLTPEEKKILLLEIHNHAMLKVPNAAPEAALNYLAAKRPDLQETIERILGRKKGNGRVSPLLK